MQIKCFTFSLQPYYIYNRSMPTCCITALYYPLIRGDLSAWLIGQRQGIFCDMFSVHFYLCCRIFKSYWIIVVFTVLKIKAVPCMWNVETKLILVVIWATGTISKSSRKYPSNIPRKHDIKKLQKTVILSTAHIFCKVKM